MSSKKTNANNTIIEVSNKGSRLENQLASSLYKLKDKLTARQFELEREVFFKKSELEKAKKNVTLNNLELIEVNKYICQLKGHVLGNLIQNGESENHRICETCNEAILQKDVTNIDTIEKHKVHSLKGRVIY